MRVLALILAVSAALLAAAASGAPPRTVLVTGRDALTRAPISTGRAPFRGKPVLIQVWGSTCLACNDEADVVVAWLRKNPGVEGLGVNVHDFPAGARAFVKRHRVTFPNVWDPRGALARRLGTDTAPAVFLLDSAHRIVARFHDSVTGRALDRAYARMRR